MENEQNEFLDLAERKFPADIDRIDKIRKQRNLTQVEVATGLGVNPRTLQRMLQNPNLTFRTSEFDKLCKVFTTEDESSPNPNCFFIDLVKEIPKGPIAYYGRAITDRSEFSNLICNLSPCNMLTVRAFPQEIEDDIIQLAQSFDQTRETPRRPLSERLVSQKTTRRIFDRITDQMLKQRLEVRLHLFHQLQVDNFGAGDPRFIWNVNLELILWPNDHPKDKRYTVRELIIEPNSVPVPEGIKLFTPDDFADGEFEDRALNARAEVSSFAVFKDTTISPPFSEYSSDYNEASGRVKLNTGEEKINKE